jgi:predicted nucleotidyltransferase
LRINSVTEEIKTTLTNICCDIKCLKIVGSSAYKNNLQNSSDIDILLVVNEDSINKVHGLKSISMGNKISIPVETKHGPFKIKDAPQIHLLAHTVTSLEKVRLITKLVWENYSKNIIYNGFELCDVYSFNDAYVSANTEICDIENQLISNKFTYRKWTFNNKLAYSTFHLQEENNYAFQRYSIRAAAWDVLVCIQLKNSDFKMDDLLCSNQKLLSVWRQVHKGCLINKNEISQYFSNLKSTLYNYA